MINNQIQLTFIHILSIMNNYNKLKPLFVNPLSRVSFDLNFKYLYVLFFGIIPCFTIPPPLFYIVFEIKGEGCFLLVFDAYSRLG